MRLTSNLLQTSLLGSGALATAFSLGATSQTGLMAGTAAMACGVGVMAFDRLRQLQSLRVVQEAAQPISDKTVQANLKRELLERYPIFAEEAHVGKCDKLAGYLVKLWVGQGRSQDTQYKGIKDCVPESLIESEIGKLRDALKKNPAENALREGVDRDQGKRIQRWKIEDAAAEALKRLYPSFTEIAYVELVPAIAKKVSETWLGQSDPIVRETTGQVRPLVDSSVHAEIKAFIDVLKVKASNEKQRTLLAALQKSVPQPPKRPEPWKLFVLPGALATGVAILAAAGWRLTAPSTAEVTPSPIDASIACRKSFDDDRFVTRAEKPLPIPVKMSFVPAWMMKDAKAQQAWILTRFVPAYLDYFECRWTERLDLEQGLRLLDEVLSAWPGKDPLEIPARIEGEAKPGMVSIASDVFRSALEDKILKKYPELSLHRTVSEARKKDAKRGVRGEDIPQVGRTIDYEGYSYAHLGARIVRWPQGSQKIAMEKELWDAAKGEWVKCLPKEAK